MIRRTASLIVFGGIVCGLVYVARSAAIPHSPAIVVSFLLLLAPLWFFGFGLDEVLRATLDSPLLRIGVSAGFVVPYLVFAIPAGAFDWKMFVGMWVLAAVPSALLESCRPNPRLVWQDAVVLLVLVATHLLRLLEPAWPAQFAAVPKLFLIDVVAYLYLIVRPIEGVGYSLVPSLSALRIGLREWLFFLPFGIGLGTVLHFTHFQARWPTVGSVGLAVVATFLFVAIPEELFFRGIVQNLLETRIGRVGALIVAAVLFGFSHYHRGGSFDWRYILLAAIAGIFYGRAWRARHQLLAAILTHTAIDVVWSMWFR